LCLGVDRFHFKIFQQKKTSLLDSHSGIPVRSYDRSCPDQLTE
jgi:hypothetical protein